MTRVKLTDAERLRRVEEALVSLALFVVERDRSRFSRSLSAYRHGIDVEEFLDAIEAERDDLQAVGGTNS